MYEITIENIPILVIRKKIKYLNMTVRAPHGRVRIAAPLQMPESNIQQFIHSNLNWIRAKIIKYQKPEAIHAPQYLSGEHHLYLGQRYYLNVIPTQGESRIVLNDNALDLYAHEQSNAISRQVVMAQWYRNELKKILIPMLEKWQAIIGVTISDFYIRHMKSRWGVCDIAEQEITFSSELIKKPLHCLEYIVVHELVHLLEASHNYRFKAFMDQFLPNWRQYKRELDNF